MTTYVVCYQKAFGFSPREEKEFSEYEKAQWFANQLKKDNYISTIEEVKK